MVKAGRHVKVMSAGMHGAGMLTGERQTRFFWHRQRIQLGPNHRYWSLTIAEDTNDTSAANLLAHFKA